LFKWIKQHLRIKAFYGTSENAEKTQIRIAVSVCVLVAIVRKCLGLEASLYQILQILSVTLFEKMPILRALQASDFDSDLGLRPCDFVPLPGRSLTLAVPDRTASVSERPVAKEQFLAVKALGDPANQSILFDF